MSSPSKRRHLTAHDLHRLACDADLVTIRTAAAAVGVHPALVRQWVTGGHVRFGVVDGRVVVPLEDVSVRERATRQHARAGGRPSPKAAGCLTRRLVFNNHLLQ